MAGTKKLDYFFTAAAGAGGLAALLLVIGCDRSQTAEAPRERATSNAVAPTAAPANASPEGGRRGMLNAVTSGPPPIEDAAEEEEGEKRGPTRTARCRINDEPERACDFTPVFGDGSFDIEMPDRQLRLIIEGNEAAPFELIGARRIPIVGLLQRDPGDPACWVSDDPDASLKRVCAR